MPASRCWDARIESCTIGCVGTAHISAPAFPVAGLCVPVPKLRRHSRGLDGRVLDVGSGVAPYRAWLVPIVPMWAWTCSLARALTSWLVRSRSGRCRTRSSTSAVEPGAEACRGPFSHPHRHAPRGETGRGVRGDLSLPAPWHGAPHDYRRFTAYLAGRLIPGCEVMVLERQGGIGSTVVILALGWIEEVLNLSLPTRILKAILLPVRPLLALGSNRVGGRFDPSRPHPNLRRQPLRAVRKPL